MENYVRISTIYVVLWKFGKEIKSSAFNLLSSFLTAIRWARIVSDNWK